jgi:hypothetical protein
MYKTQKKKKPDEKDEEESSVFFSVAYLSLPITVRSSYMGRQKSEELAYRSSCGVSFELPLFPSTLATSLTAGTLKTSIRTSNVIDAKDVMEKDRSPKNDFEKVQYKPEFIFLSRISVSVRIRRLILSEEIDMVIKRTHDLRQLEQRCEARSKQLRKR